MKKLIFFFFLMFSVPIFAQNENRTEIEGQIQVPIGAEAGGITVFNLNSLNGAVTNDEGEFEISVKLNDSLAVSAVQYQKFIVIVDEGIISSKSLKITVREAVNELEEVIVRPYDLSGNVSVDIQKVDVLVDPLKMTSEEILNVPMDTPADRRPVENMAMNDPFMKNGLNFVNIFKAIFNSDKNRKTYSKEPVQNVETKVRELYEDEFFQEYIDVEKENIHQFILFAKSNGLNNEMMQPGRELDLIEFLIEQGKIFKSEQKRK